MLVFSPFPFCFRSDVSVNFSPIVSAISSNLIGLATVCGFVFLIRITYIHTYIHTCIHVAPRFTSHLVHNPHFLCSLCFPLLHYPIHLVWIGEHHTTHCSFVTFIIVKEIPTITNSKSVNESTSAAVYTHTITR